MYKYYFILSHHFAREVFSIIFILSMLSYEGYRTTDFCPNSIDTKKTGTEVGFKSIPVKEHDTLWSIAKENYPKEYSGSLNDYIREIKRCNSLISNSINAGSSIIVPVYISVNYTHE